MKNESSLPLSDVTRSLPMELYAQPRSKVSRYDDSDLRAPRVEMYARRLANGQDLWSGEPLGEAYEEATRILEQQSKPKCGGRRPRNHNCVNGAV